MTKSQTIILFFLAFVTFGMAMFFLFVNMIRPFWMFPGEAPPRVDIDLLEVSEEVVKDSLHIADIFGLEDAVEDVVEEEFEEDGESGNEEEEIMEEGEKIEVLVEEPGFWEGCALVENTQFIPVEGAVVTLQLVDNSGPYITQAISDEKGLACVDFVITEGAWRVEILDITGKNFLYNKALNEISILTGRMTYPEEGAE